MSVSNKIAVAANVSIIVTCVILVGVVAALRGPQLVQAARPGPYGLGDTFTEVAAEAPAQNKGTLVVVFRTNCVPCNASKDFHRKLTERVLSAGAGRVVAVSTDPESVVSDYLKQSAIPVSSVKIIERANLRVRATPTLMWLDEKGVIKQVWVGQLTPDAEERVLKTLSL